MRKPFKTYLEALTETARRGDAREESFYHALAVLIEDVAQATGRDVQVTISPRPTEAGNPDFRVWDGKQHIVGYIEAKPPTEELLDRAEASEQLRRYRSTFPNLILTNFLEFRLYRNGERVGAAILGRPVVLTTLRHTPPLENADQVWALLEQFLGFALPRPLTPEDLALELAKRTRFLRDIVGQQLEQEKDRQERPLSLGEIRTYCQIVTALARTLEVQAEVDEAYAQVEAAPLPIGNA